MIYLDASVVVSLHLRDANTPEALRLVNDATENLLVSALCEMETINAFALRVFRREMSALNMDNAVRYLETDLRSGVLKWKPIPEAAFTRAKKLSRKITPAVGVRAADLLHIAAALELGAKTLYTFDQRQHQAAQAAGLTINQLPSLYP
jgi:predicted nucleic acid-binding protein